MLQRGADLVSCDKYHDQKKLGKEVFIWLVYSDHSLSPRETRVGTQAGQGTGGRN